MKKAKRIIALGAWLAAIVLMAVACDDRPEIQQVYGFDLETMPVQKRIANGETAEIRCAIVREGDYEQTRYYIRYFQPDGRGELRLDNGMLLLPNDLYPLGNTVFRLYYTSLCDERQTIDVYVEDNMGQLVQKTFSFQNEGDEEEPENPPHFAATINQSNN